MPTSERLNGGYNQNSRSDRNWRKDNALTGGSLVAHGMTTARSQQRFQVSSIGPLKINYIRN
jgi:hypothetical protein